MNKDLPVYQLNLVEARSRMETSAKNHVYENVEDIEEYLIPTPDSFIKARLFTPKDCDDGLIVYFHGGAFTLNSINTHDFLFRKIANSTKHKVLGVDFRLSPEYKFPIPLNDCIASIVWAHGNSNLLKYNQEKLYVGGDSTGGTLTLASSIYLRDIGLNFINKIFMIYPPLDSYNPGTQSYIEKGSFPVSKEFLKWGWDNYLPNHFNRENPYIFPLKAKTFKHLPNMLLMFSGCDALVDENKELVSRLIKENISFEYKCFDNELHGFMMKDEGDATKEAISKIVKFLN